MRCSLAQDGTSSTPKTINPTGLSKTPLFGSQNAEEVNPTAPLEPATRACLAHSGNAKAAACPCSVPALGRLSFPVPAVAGFVPGHQAGGQVFQASMNESTRGYKLSSLASVLYRPHEQSALCPHLSGQINACRREDPNQTASPNVRGILRKATGLKERFSTPFRAFEGWVFKHWLRAENNCYHDSSYPLSLRCACAQP